MANVQYKFSRFARNLLSVSESKQALRYDRLYIGATFAVSLFINTATYYFLFFKTVSFSKYQLFATEYLKNTLDKERLIDFSPLYFYVHVAVKKICSNSDSVILWLQFLAVAASTSLLFILLRSFFKTWIALAGTVAYVLSPSIILYASVYEPEAFLLFFLSGFLVCVLRKTLYMALFAGLFLGLCLVTRLNLFPLLAIVPLFFWLNHERGTRVGKRIIIFLAPVLFALLGLMARNHAITGSFNPVVMNPGNVFYEGNNPLANGQCVVYPPMIDNVIDEFSGEPDPAHAIYRLLPRRINKKDYLAAESNSYWAQKAINFILDNPVYYARQIQNKLVCIIHNARWHDIIPVISNDLGLQKGFIPTIPFGLIAAMALIGILLSYKAWKQQFVFYAVILCQVSVMVLTYCSDRQRIAIIPLFIYFACFLLQMMLNKKDPLWVRGISLFAVIVLFPFLIIKNDFFKDGLFFRSQFDAAQDTMYKASQARQNGELLKASQLNALVFSQIPYLRESRLSGLQFAPKPYEARALSIAESLYLDKKSPSAQFNLLTLYLENNATTQASTIVQELIRKKTHFNRNSSQSSQPFYYLAKIDEMHGDTIAAITHLKLALKKNPGDPWVLSHLAVLTGNSLYKKKIIRYFDEVDADYYMGLANLANKRYENAARCFTNVIKIVPEYRDGYIYLAIALGGQKNYAAAAEYYAESMQKKREPLFGEQEILNIFHGWVEQDPSNEKAQYFLAMTLQDFGHFEEAAAVLSSLRKNNPGWEKIIESNAINSTYR